MNNKSLLLICLSMMLGGCQSTGKLFYWGDYESLVHTSYSNPGTLPASLHISQLQAIILDAETKNLRPAPGIYAQLGVIAVENGQKSMAVQSFKKEAELYPESQAFMQYLLETMNDRDAESAPEQAKQSEGVHNEVQ